MRAIGTTLGRRARGVQRRGGATELPRRSRRLPWPRLKSGARDSAAAAKAPYPWGRPQCRHGIRHVRGSLSGLARLDHCSMETMLLDRIMPRTLMGSPRIPGRGRRNQEWRQPAATHGSPCFRSSWARRSPWWGRPSHRRPAGQGASAPRSRAATPTANWRRRGRRRKRRSPCSTCRGPDRTHVHLRSTPSRPHLGSTLDRPQVNPHRPQIDPRSNLNRLHIDLRSAAPRCVLGSPGVRCAYLSISGPVYP